MRIVTITQSAFDEMVAHAREGKPEEICGIVRGKGLEAFETIRGQNIAEERIENYAVDATTLLLQFEFEDREYADGGTEMVGIYHSHPVSEAFPSATDAWNAHYPEAIYFICSLEFDDAPVVRAFQMTSHDPGEELTHNLDEWQNQLELNEIRPQSNVFAYFQPENSAIHPLLASIATQLPTPFYFLLWFDEHAPESPEVKVVPIVEYALKIGHDLASSS